jgi:hypothetical protein
MATLTQQLLLTIPEAARRLRLGERALRRVLADPAFSARLVARTRKVGIYHKCVSLLPPDLLADLARRAPDRAPEPAAPRNG